MSTTSIIRIGMDVHKDTVMVAVFEDRANEPVSSGRASSPQT